MRRRRKMANFEPIVGVKKVISCMGCGKKIEVTNLNRQKCKDCGYREERTKAYQIS